MMPARSRRSALRTGIVALSLLAPPASPLRAQETPAEAQAAIARVVARLQPEIRRAMVEGAIPSVTVALADADGELWSAAYGESNLWAHTPATTNTVYLIGSTFKAQSTIALLQQMEQGKFALDDPVHDYIGDLVIRGEDPSDPVRFRHLLTHTSGMPVDFGPHLVWGETAPLPLEEYLADSLRVTGPPGRAVVYSNMAYSLVGYLVQRFSGVPYKEYMREHVWGALGMEDTEFDLPPRMEERLAIPYVPDESTGRLAPTERLKANVWPAGIVYGTIHDQARWVSFNLGGGMANGSQLVQESTIEQMQTLQFPHLAGEPISAGWGYDDPGYGLTWWTTTRGDQAYFAHSGSVPGYTAFVMGNRGTGHGVVLLTNGHAAHPHLIRLSNLAIDLMDEILGGGG